MKDVPIPFWGEKRKLSKSEAAVDYLFNLESKPSERELAERWGWTRYEVRLFKDEISTKFQPNFNHLEYWKSIIKALSSTKFQPNFNQKKPTKLTLQERKKIFTEQLAKYKEKYGSDMLNAFWRYWAESDKGGNKMRFELQPTWSLAGRLETWKKKGEEEYGKRTGSR